MTVDIVIKYAWWFHLLRPVMVAAGDVALRMGYSPRQVYRFYTFVISKASKAVVVKGGAATR